MYSDSDSGYLGRLVVCTLVLDGSFKYGGAQVDWAGPQLPLSYRCGSLSLYLCTYAALPDTVARGRSRHVNVPKNKKNSKEDRSTLKC